MKTPLSPITIAIIGLFASCQLSALCQTNPTNKLLPAIIVRQPGTQVIDLPSRIKTGPAPTITAEMGDKGGTFFGNRPKPQTAHHYYISAEVESWDYAPQGQEAVCGMTSAQPLVRDVTANKLRYVEYTDNTFQKKVKSDPGLGILGPVLRGVVGEFIEVTFLNRTSQPLSIHPHGVKYDKDSEGAYYLPRPGLGAAVGTNARFTYVWQLNEKSGPASNEPSSKAWLYHSHVSGDGEANLGLIGFIIVTDPHRARSDGTPADVDRELASLFMIFDESGLAGLDKEALEHGRGPGGRRIGSKAQLDELIEQGQRYAINGRVFCNLSGLEMNEGEHVRWYLFALGSEQDFHTPHWHGVDVVEEGRRGTDVVELLPGTMKVADMDADNPGTWLFHCHVAEHMQHGMAARFVIHPKNGADRAPTQGFFGMAQARESLQGKQ